MASRSDGVDGDLDAEFSLGDGTAEMEATVVCPYCGESLTIAVDPGGGTEQEYVEDCEVCCRPWAVRVTYEADGSASVELGATDGEL